MQTLKSKRHKQKCQSLVEYLVIVALVGIGGISIMGTVGQSLEVAFGKVAKSLGASGSVDTKATITSTQLKKRSLRNFVNGQGKSDDKTEESGDDE